MTEEIKQQNQLRPVAPGANRPGGFGGGRPGFGRGPRKGPEGDRSGFRRNPRGPRRETRVKPEFDTKIVDIRRVTRVVAGGKRFNFSVALIAGNRKGTVGFGMGKAADTALAIEKATRSARKNMMSLNLTKDMSIPHDIKAKFAASKILLMPARGRGMVAGSSVRVVLELAGVKDVAAKLMSGSKNRLNNAKVTLAALSKLMKPKVPSKKEEKKEEQAAK